MELAPYNYLVYWSRPCTCICADMAFVCNLQLRYEYYDLNFDINARNKLGKWITRNLLQTSSRNYLRDASRHRHVFSQCAFSYDYNKSWIHVILCGYNPIQMFKSLSSTAFLVSNFNLLLITCCFTRNWMSITFATTYFTNVIKSKIPNEIKCNSSNARLPSWSQITKS